MTQLQTIHDALNIVQHSLSLYDHEQAETLQAGIDLWVYAPRLYEQLKYVVAYAAMLEKESVNAATRCDPANVSLRNARELIATIEN